MCAADNPSFISTSTGQPYYRRQDSNTSLPTYDMFIKGNFPVLEIGHGKETQGGLHCLTNSSPPTMQHFDTVDSSTNSNNSLPALEPLHGAAIPEVSMHSQARTRNSHIHAAENTVS